jgi:hypothetical protein
MYVQLDKKERVYAHKDIAYEFGTAISVEFRYMVFKEYQRLKEREANKNNPEWNFKRLMAKFNYVVHTDAIKRFRIPFVSPSSHPFIYSSEADMINKVLFGITAKEWREQHIDLVAKNQNLREFASENELVVLSNLEVLNAEMMADGIDIVGRKAKLTEASKRYMDALNTHDIKKSFRKTAYGDFKPFLKFPGDRAA